MEKDVMASTQSKLDWKRVDTLLESTVDDKNSNTATSVTSGSLPPSFSSWSVSLASASTLAIVSYLISHSIVISGMSFVVFGVIANGDPFEEEGPAGAIARIIGRTTLKSVETATPVVRSVARAAVKGDAELAELHLKIQDLEQENRELKQWIERRKVVDDALPKYNLTELKNLAREKGVSVGGTKAQLMLRLVETGMVDL
eukprot:CAMPEP_0195511056 /NCGR_PEP_ID=MMETSP0794_2-20130614/3512_1 /TAXON_ID=515487 /ORGANISM="Stephanopyxis turris, Strain CCMP 815" /LENGTH=200 /DNA_ID=CAMNT_0040638599 /DNA_START=338 /DNA_END=940 /DNA_ORIENTATION=+